MTDHTTNPEINETLEFTAAIIRDGPIIG